MVADLKPAEAVMSEISRLKAARNMLRARERIDALQLHIKSAATNM